MHARAANHGRNLRQAKEKEGLDKPFTLCSSISGAPCFFCVHPVRRFYLATLHLFHRVPVIENI
jgi:hypothetical protein